MSSLPTPQNRGQVGIGTLIIFIAMVLVAAIGASVLVNTAGQLQSQAEVTGEQAQREVVNRYHVVDVIGKTGPNNSSVKKINITVKLAAGSDDVNMSETTLIYTTEDAHQIITFDDDDIDGVDIMDSHRTGYGYFWLNGTNLSPGESAQIKLVTQSGSETTIQVNVPVVLEGKQYVRL